MSAVLSISSPRIHGCEVLSDLLVEKGILSFDVTKNDTFVGGRKETGCRIHMKTEDARRAWRAIRSGMEEEVSCAHVKLPHTEGCSSDVFSPSRCPWKGARKKKEIRKE